MKKIILNNIKVVAIFCIIGVSLFGLIVLLMIISESIRSESLHTILITSFFLLSFFVYIGTGYILAKKILLSTGNLLYDSASFILIIALVVCVFLPIDSATHPLFNVRLFIGAGDQGVLGLCITVLPQILLQYAGMVSRRKEEEKKIEADYDATVRELITPTSAETPDSVKKNKTVVYRIPAIVLGTIFAIGIAFVAFSAILSISIKSQQLPTSSKANELRVAPYDVILVTLSVNLEYSDGSKHVLDIKKGTLPGELQNYTLPKLPDGAITVHVVFASHDIPNYAVSGDMDVIVFTDARELRRNGLLLYFKGDDLYVISGKTVTRFSYDRQAGDWIVLENSMKPIDQLPGMKMPDSILTDWKTNEWQYFEK